jgi:hypothetical protein
VINLAATIFNINNTDLIVEGFGFVNGTSFTQLIASVESGSLVIQNCAVVATFGELIDGSNSVILWNSTSLSGCAAQTFFSFSNSTFTVSENKFKFKFIKIQTFKFKN